MLRCLLIVALAALVLGLGAGQSLGAEEWPGVDLPKKWRGPGLYLHWGKMLACWLVFLVWVRSADWASRDLQELKLNYIRWNPIVCGTFFGAFVLMWLIPYFWLGFSLLVIALVAPFTSYVVHRNGQVTNDQRVFTPAHIRYWIAVHLNKLGMKIAVEAQDPHEKGPPVVLLGQGSPDQRTDQARLVAARQTPGMLPAREVIHDGLSHRAMAIMLDYSPQAVAVRFMIDGVWLNREAMDREAGDPALETLKTLCGLNAQDRQNRQKGTFGVEFDSINYASTLASQGTKSGERSLIQFEDKKIRFDTIDELGMRPKIQEQLKELLDLPKGLILLSAMPANGLRSTADVVIHHTDRFTREFMAVEEQTRRYEDVENCPVTTYNAAEGETPDAILPKVFRLQPDVVVLRDLINGETVSLMCQEIPENRLFISTVRAKDTADALLRVLALGVPPEEFAGAASGVLGQRLVRTLCNDCKEAYSPTPQILQQLGIPEGRIQAFYRPPEQPEEICPQCGGIGYRGRTAVFEFLKVGDAVRKALRSGPSIEALRQAGRKDGMRSLQEEGILLVAKGVTSLPELMRVLKQ